jgi:hypothetical protein
MTRRRPSGSPALIVLMVLAIGVASLLWPHESVDAIDICLEEKEDQNECGDANCHRLPTSLWILSDTEVAPEFDGFRPAGKCGWKFCGELICSCGDRLSGSVCQGVPPWCS